MNVVKAVFCSGLIVTGIASFRPAPVPQPMRATQWPVMAADTGKIDAETGLIDDPNLMMVKSQCTACHSSKLILQHRFTRAGWTERIRWMQKYHKLWDLGESEKVVLDYLEKNYGPESASKAAIFRRQPLQKIQWYKLDQ